MQKNMRTSLENVPETNEFAGSDLTHIVYTFCLQLPEEQPNIKRDMLVFYRSVELISENIILLAVFI